MNLFEILRAFNEGDLGTLRERVAPDVTYVIPGRAAVSGEFSGIDEVAYAFHFEDGKLAGGRLFPGDLHAIEAFFG